ncbi:MAG: hypothetical protein COB53_01120 [Elusimicrobia bacterium]|nr:MAG: hypothetical protein COB53_01120 [Elusimicrobiota bacterium]
MGANRRILMDRLFAMRTSFTIAPTKYRNEDSKRPQKDSQEKRTTTFALLRTNHCRHYSAEEPKNYETHFLSYLTV